jgi:Putative DNA-binding domain
VNDSFLPDLMSWNLDTVRQLVVKRVFENDYFDFKQSLPDSRNQTNKDRLAKTCAAFANSNGGYLVFGVRDEKAIASEERIVGVESGYEFPEHFGVYPSKCSPSVPWTIKNPAITLSGSKLVHVVYIPKSWQAPHGISKENGTWEFPKRTNKGNENMSLEEIRSGFLNFYEKRLRLVLLKSELEELKYTSAQLGNVDPTNEGNGFSPASYELSVINNVLADSFSILTQKPDMLRTLNRIRSMARSTNNEIALFRGKISMPLTDARPMTREHNSRMKQQGAEIYYACEVVMPDLNTLIV